MTQKEAKELTLKVWRYLAEHPECSRKDQIPEYLYDKIRKLFNRCPLCEVFTLGIGYCPGCPLKRVGEWCLDDASAWYMWENSAREDNATRKKAARRIVKIVSAWEPEDER